VPQRLQFDPAAADAQGFVAIGGDLRPATLLRAYRNGVFPWYDESMPICWWSPDPRAILPLDYLHVSRRLARTLRSGRFQSTMDRDFAGVIRGCAENRGDGTWLVPEMIAAYQRLHELGRAHSIEVWRGDELAGGLYGVAIGGFFSAESMFHRVTDASKVAIVGLVDRLRAGGFELIDIQFLTAHTARLGGIEIPKTEYLRRLTAALNVRGRRRPR
jgi:leucyl/phenylalanyl-tRNA--protein transferase